MYVSYIAILYVLLQKCQSSIGIIIGIDYKLENKFLTVSEIKMFVERKFSKIKPSIATFLLYSKNGRTREAKELYSLSQLCEGELT